ncbi:MAG: CHASE4 domain-containing protein [Armatimonadota bacterium]
MTLRIKTLFVLSAILIGLIAALYYASRMVVMQGFLDLEKELALRDIQRLRNALYEEGSKLNSGAGDWAEWDDTYNFITTRDSRYIASTITIPSFTELKVNYILILNNANQPLIATGYHSSQAHPRPIPQGLRQWIIERAAFPSPGMQSKSRVGLLVLPGGNILLVAARRILTSNGTGPSPGTLIMARDLNAEAQQHLSRLTRLSLSMYPLGGSDIPHEAQVRITSLTLDSPTSIQILDAYAMNGLSLLPDIDGKPALVLNVDMQREVYRRGLVGTRALLLIFLIAGIVVVLASMIFLELSVLARLSTLSTTVRDIGGSGNFSQCILVNGRDELSGLTDDINNMLRTAEQAIRDREESDARYQAVVKQTLEAILLLDCEQYRILEANAAAADLLGYSPEELQILNWSNVVAEWDSMQDIFQRVARQQRHFSGTQVWHRKDGHTFDVELNITHILMGGAEALCIVARDITKTKKLEAELRKTDKLESLGILAGGIAHDFNNLLAAILGNLSLVKSQLPARSPLEQRLIDAEKASLRARDLTQRLLTFSQGGTPIKQITSVADIIREATDFALLGSRVRCQLSLPADLWPAEVDDGQITQVLHNLIINADQAMPSGGVISVRADNLLVQEETLPLKQGPYLRIAVEDKGTGISDEALPKIFDPYFTTKQRGSGLGLATTYSIIKNHDGLVSVDSTPGEGTVFTIYLPASPAAEVHIKRLEPTLRPGSGRILVMDDETIVREVIVDILEASGYETVAVADGQEALEQYRAAIAAGQPFDLVIIDLTIPGGMGGKETVSRLREMDPTVRAVVTSGYSNDPVMSDYAAYGFQGMLVKPFQVDDLQTLVSQLLTSERTVYRPAG